jgi:hypothetical protein
MKKKKRSLKGQTYTLTLDEALLEAVVLGLKLASHQFSQGGGGVVAKDVQFLLGKLCPGWHYSQDSMDVFRAGGVRVCVNGEEIE